MPYMINRIWSLKKNYDYMWMVMLDFIYMGSADLFGTGREQKIQNENICSQRDSNHTKPAHDRNVSVLDRAVTLVRYQIDHL